MNDDTMRHWLAWAETHGTRTREQIASQGETVREHDAQVRVARACLLTRKLRTQLDATPTDHPDHAQLAALVVEADELMTERVMALDIVRQERRPDHATARPVSIIATRETAKASEDRADDTCTWVHVANPYEHSCYDRLTSGIVQVSDTGELTAWPVGGETYRNWGTRRKTCAACGWDRTNPSIMPAGPTQAGPSWDGLHADRRAAQGRYARQGHQGVRRLPQQRGWS